MASESSISLPGSVSSRTGTRGTNRSISQEDKFFGISLVFFGPVLYNLTNVALSKVESGEKTVQVRLLSVALLACLSASSFSFGISEDFESYALGTFPSPTWSDTGLIQPVGNIPNPSSLIERKTTESGTQTHALNFGDYFGYDSGIYTATGPGRFYSVTADIRVDRFGTQAPPSSASDWPVAAGFNQFDANETPSGWISIQVYASTLTKDWRVYGYDGVNSIFDIALGASPDIGVWDRVSFSFDNQTGTIATNIQNLRTGATTVNRTDVLAGWASPTLDTLAFFNGQDSNGDPNAISGLANVDNINANVVPEPASMAALGIGLAAILRRRRR